jgi:hypothetical protein
MNNLQLKGSKLLGRIVTLGRIGQPAANITIRPTRFVLENGFLSYKDMQMDVGDNPVNFGGTIGLDGKLDMKVILPYTLDGRTVRVGEEAGLSRFQFHLKGTIQNPEIDMGKLFEEQLGQLLLKGLQKLMD